MPTDAPTGSRPAPYGVFIDAIIGGRAEQQDAVLVAPVPLGRGHEALLMVVADGMGGHAGGQVASETAVDAFKAAFFAHATDAVRARLRAGLDAANNAIAERMAASPELAGMGCTLVAAVLDGRHAAWISVGDTLLVAAEGGPLKRLNEDHSMGGLLDAQAARGEISHEEAMASGQRHMLRAAVTGGRIALIDEGEATLAPGSLLFAATDGVLTLRVSELTALAGPEAGPEAFVRAVLDAISRDMPSDQDNTTLAAALVPGTRRPAAPGPAGSARRGAPWRGLLAGLMILVGLAAAAVVGLVMTQERRSQAAALRPTQPVAAAASPSGAAASDVGTRARAGAPSFVKPIKLPLDQPASGRLVLGPQPKPAAVGAKPSEPAPAPAKPGTAKPGTVKPQPAKPDTAKPAAAKPAAPPPASSQKAGGKDDAEPKEPAKPAASSTPKEKAGSTS